jgi:hypothetical protein
MRRVVLAFTAFAALSISIAHAGEQVRVVVNELDANGVAERVSRIVSDHLRSKLIETQRFLIPERDKMEMILGEQAIGVTLGECYSQECAIELGRLLQANKMVVGTVSLLAETYNISIRFLDLESGTAEFSAEEKVQSTEDLYLAAERLAARIIAFIPPRGAITAVDDENLIVNVGRADGVTPGMRFRLMRPVEHVPGYPEEEPVGVAEVASVQEDWSRLTIDQTASVARRAIIQIGDMAIGPQTIAVDELPRYAFLMVYSRPVGAEVYVDNLFRGRTGDGGLEVKLPPGQHQVRLGAPAHKGEERRVELQPSQRLPFNATLQPIFPRRVFNLPLLNVSYLRQNPTDDLFRSQLETGSLQGVQVGFGRVYSVWTTEIGGSWTMANMAQGKGYGLDEVHRISAYGQLGLAIPAGFIVPYGVIGYEVGQFMFSQKNATDSFSSIGSAGKVKQDGWYWSVGVYLRRWIHVGYRGTFRRPETDLQMITFGINVESL